MWKLYCEVNPGVRAFDDLGLVGNQGGVSCTVLGKLGLDAVPHVGEGLPILEQLKEIWPANAVIPIDLVFGTVSKYARQAAAGELKSGVSGFSPGRIAAPTTACPTGAVPPPPSPEPASCSNGSAPVVAAASSGKPGPAAAAEHEQQQQQQNGGEAAGLLTCISRLKEEKTALRAERKRVQSELRNAEKRRSRLKKRARQLTDGDLMTVLHMRTMSKKADEEDGGDKEKIQKGSSSKAGEQTLAAE